MAEHAKQGGEVDEILNDFNKKSSTMTILIIVFVLITLVGGAGAGYFFLVKGKSGESHDEKPAKAEEKERPAEKAEQGGHSGGEGAGAGLGVVVKLDPFIVNLNEIDASRYLKVAMEVEVGNEEVGKEIEKRSPQIRDIAVNVLSSKSFAEIQGSDGKFRLKEELIFSFNKVLMAGQIKSVYFTQFVVQ